MPFSIEPSTEIAFRVDFCLLCNARGYVDAAEVGVDRGIFARAFLDRWHGSIMSLIDPYAPYSHMPYDRTLDAMTAIQALQPHHGRFKFIRERSPEAIQSVMAVFRAPRFVYIDGNHEEFDVYEDIKEWFKVIPDDGMIAGHDFTEDHPGVMSAVRRFAEEKGLVVRLTHEESFPKSWYFYKVEPATLFQRLFTEAEIPNPHHPRGADG